MPKRDWPLQFRCAHEGCSERVTYRYETLRDLKSSFELKHYGGGNGWLCTRHSRPNELLSLENTETCVEMVSRQEDHGRYFGTAGFVSGPGFKLFADDFPAGTKLIVTARIELPEDISSQNRGVE